MSCPGTVLVGRGDTCSSDDRWSATPLFPWAEASNETLRRFCVYEWQGPGRPTPAQRPRSNLEVDCAMSAALAAPLPDLTKAREAAFLEHVRALDPLPAPTGSRQPPVRVAVVDTARNLAAGRKGEPGAGNSSHGRAVGLVISRLTCPNGPGSRGCLTEIDNRIGLGLVREGTEVRRDPNGGYFGLFSEVARAIGDAVASAGADQRLILNLSFGWDGTFGGSDLAHLGLPIEAVYQVIRYARCRGALAIAATGNSAGERPPASVGPFFPAGWQRQPAPSDVACRNDFGLPGSRGGSGPLVIAATGVDPSDQFLLNTPTGGISEVAAPAAQVIVSDPAPPANAPAPVPLTGSSMAAAVVSSAAAITWAYQPRLPPQQVLEKVKEAGVDLGVRADYCAGGAACDNVRRVSLCQMVKRACDAGHCTPLLTPCADDPARSPAGSSPTFATAPIDPCRGPRAPASCSPPSTTEYRNEPLVPLMEPQPTGPICPDCDLGTNQGLLDLRLNPALSNYLFNANTLWIDDDLTPTEGWLWIDLRNRLPRDQPGGTSLNTVLDLAGIGVWGTIHSVAVDFSYTDIDIFGLPVTQVKTEWLWLSP